VVLFTRSVFGVISETALLACAARAAHTLVDRPPYVLEDPLAVTMLGDRADELIDYHRQHGSQPIPSAARMQVITRARFTEDRLAAAGVDQYVLLGAGLDSFAHRSPLAASIKVFEVDQPDTQEYKKSVAPAGPVTYVPVDFETDELLASLVRAGFDPARPSLVSWLGVVLYLDRPAIERALAVVGGFAAGTELIVEHMLPAGHRDAAGDEYVAALGPAIAARGEPWRSLLSTSDMAGLLAAHGFTDIHAVSQRDAIDPSLWERTDSLRPIQLSVFTHGVVG
jgi:methyltransferase (TIGR00027 family)